MTFTLTLSGADLLLLLPEMLLTVWLCVVLTVDFAMPRLPKDRLAYLSVAGLAGGLAHLGWVDPAGVGGAPFAHMFVGDPLPGVFQIFHLGGTLPVIPLPGDHFRRVPLF